MKKALILGGGEIKNYTEILSHLDEDTMIFCADSGYNHALKMNLTPDYIVGDLDSLKNPPKEIPIIRLSPDKDYTDTTLTIKTAVEKGCGNLVLAGMLGGRIDHTLSNIQSLVYCLENNLNAFITDGETHIYAIKAEGEKVEIVLPPKAGHYFSLISFSSECTCVNIVNAKYLLHDHLLTNTIPRAVSNQFLTDTPATISLTNGIMLITVLPFD